MIRVWSDGNPEPENEMTLFTMSWTTPKAGRATGTSGGTKPATKADFLMVAAAVAIIALVPVVARLFG